MRFTLTAGVLIAMLLVPAITLATEDMSQYSGMIEQLPDSIKGALGTETISLNVEMEQGSVQTFGIKTENGVLTGYQEGAYPNPTMAIHVSNDVVQKLAQSDDKVAVIKAEWGTGIRLEGLTFSNSVKLFFVDLGFRLYRLFSGTGSDQAASKDVTYCEDSDGNGNYMIKGTCSDSTGTYTDYCESKETVRDWYCSGTYGSSGMISNYCRAGGYVVSSWKAGECVDGAWLEGVSGCTPSWSCGSWSPCSTNVTNNTQTRTCIDSNSCGTTSGRPATVQDC